MEGAREGHDATAESFGPWRWPSPMVDRLGDLQCHRTDPARFGFVVDEPNLNGRGYVTPVRIGGRQAVGTAMFTNAGRRIGFATATFMPS